MKRLLLYSTSSFGICIIAFGLYGTYNYLLKSIKYSRLKDADLEVITEYGTSIQTFEKEIWKSFLFCATISIIGWAAIYFADKYFSNKRWINDEYAPMVIILLLAIPAYYFFSSF